VWGAAKAETAACPPDLGVGALTWIGSTTFVCTQRSTARAERAEDDPCAKSRKRDIFSASEGVPRCGADASHPVRCQARPSVSTWPALGHGSHTKAPSLRCRWPASVSGEPLPVLAVLPRPPADCPGREAMTLIAEIGMYSSGWSSCGKGSSGSKTIPRFDMVGVRIQASRARESNHKRSTHYMSTRWQLPGNEERIPTSDACGDDLALLGHRKTWP
jgi:hypothetical protein